MSVDYESIMEDFINEANELLDRAETAILTLEQEGFKQDLVNDIFRAVHTIKGNSGLFELNKISSLSHSLENVLNRLRNREMEPDMNTIDLVLSCLDRLRGMIRDVGRSNEYNIEDLVERLNRLTGSGEASPGAAPSPSEGASRKGAEGGTERSSGGEKKAPPEAAGARAAGGMEHPASRGVAPHENFQLRIPAKFLRMAKDEHRFLSLVYLDLNEQKMESLSHLTDRIKLLKENHEILMSGPREDRIRILNEVDDLTIPYYLLLSTETPVEEWLEKNQIQSGMVRLLFRPESNGHKKVTSGAEVALPPDVEEETMVNHVEESPVERSAERSEEAVASHGVAEEQERPVGGSGEEMSYLKLDGGGIFLKPKEPGPVRGEHPSGEGSVSPVVSGGTVPSGGSPVGTGGGVRGAGMPEFGQGDTHLRVPIKLIDSLINLAGETVIARNEMMQRITQSRDVGLEMSGKRMSYLITRLQEGIMRTRLQELNTVFQKLPRIVRDAASSTGKKVELVLEGGQVELDKTLIDVIGESMMHMIRNAVDHGLEGPEERVRLGKKEQGLVKVAAQLRGGNVILTIRDDGKGLDLDRIRGKAVSQGLITKEESLTMGPEEIADLVFLPGLSTAEKVTKTSGRGVGMDVVRANFKKVGGSVDIQTEQGRGTTITATLPQTLTIVTCLMVKSCDTLFALPQQNVVELILLDREHLSEVEGHDVYDLRGHLLPLLNLGEVLTLTGNESANPVYIVVVNSERHHFGLLIEEIVNLEEIVVKRLGEHFSGLSLFSGAAIMGDGESVLILDVPGLAKFTNLQANAEEESEERGRGGVLEEHVERGYLLFSVYGQQFGVNVETVPRIERITKDQIGVFMGVEIIQYRGEIVPVVRLEELYDFETRSRDSGDLYVIIFTIDGVRTGIVATEIYNVVGEIPDIDHRKFAGNSIVGHAILKDVITLVLDAVDLLTRLQSTSFKEIVKVVRRRQAAVEGGLPGKEGGKTSPGKEGPKADLKGKSQNPERKVLSGTDKEKSADPGAPSPESETEVFVGPGAISGDRG